MGLIRSLVVLVLLACVAVFGATVPLGKHTLFGHLSRVWASEEAQEMVESVKEEGGPALERVRRGVEAGLKEVRGDTPDRLEDADDASAPGAAAGSAAEASSASDSEPGSVKPGQARPTVRKTSRPARAARR